MGGSYWSQKRQLAKKDTLVRLMPGAGVQLLINSDYRNDMETHELFASEVMPHFG